jgi:DNA polymerase V
MIGLVDGNNFFVSCERVFDPSLEGKPVAVLSNNDGCCISRSNEFKALNISMGTPYFQLKPHIQNYGLILKSSNYELYGDMSRRIIATLHEFVPKVEQYSIDEAYIHPALPETADFFAFGCKVRQTILKWIGIPCGVGFAPTKTLAKIANHIGKKQPSGVFVMPHDLESVLGSLPVGEVWGVGRALTPKLERMGIRTAWQLSQQDVAAMQKKFSVILGRTIMELRGTPCIEEELPDELSQSISCSRSFGHPVVDLCDLEESIATYTAKAAEKLRKEGQRAAGANVYFQMYPEYEPVKLDAAITSATITFDVPTDDTGKMLAAIRPKLKGIFVDGRRYKKSGVIFFGLESGETQQLDLFAPPKQTENSELFKVVDQLNAKFGRGAVFTLAEGIKKPWQMKRDLLTPSYTTNWNQLLKVK